MERPVLDKIDFNILVTLARDCRTSYSSMGSMVGLTSKSVKARVKNMVRSGVIEKFIVRVNSEGFGSRTARILVMTNKGVTKDDVIQRVKQFGDLAYHVHHMGRTSIAAVIIKKSLDNKTIQSLNDALNPATVSRITVSELPVSKDLSVSDTDLRSVCYY
jgi:DNA-binding Lrp family transcriptional regulator